MNAPNENHNENHTKQQPQSRPYYCLLDWHDKKYAHAINMFFFIIPEDYYETSITHLKKVHIAKWKEKPLWNRTDVNFAIVSYL